MFPLASSRDCEAFFCLSLSFKGRICFWLVSVLILSISKNVWRNSRRAADVPSSKALHLHSCPDRAKKKKKKKVSLPIY